MEQIWAPIESLRDSDLCLYIEFSCTACIPGGGCNVERALQVLHQSKGDIKMAMERLLTERSSVYGNNNRHPHQHHHQQEQGHELEQASNIIANNSNLSDHSISNVFINTINNNNNGTHLSGDNLQVDINNNNIISSNNSDNSNSNDVTTNINHVTSTVDTITATTINNNNNNSNNNNNNASTDFQRHRNDNAYWTEDEVHLFERLIMLHGKNFSLISQDLKSKSVKECVEFYYLWKKSPIRNSNLSSTSLASSLSSSVSHTSSTSSSASNPTSTLSSTSYHSAITTSQDFQQLTPVSRKDNHSSIQLNPHEQIALATQQLQQQYSQQAQPSQMPPVLPPITFPCKVCGRVFEKIKSRSAHMKRHKNER